MYLPRHRTIQVLDLGLSRASRVLCWMWVLKSERSVKYASLDPSSLDVPQVLVCDGIRFKYFLVRVLDAVQVPCF